MISTSSTQRVCRCGDKTRCDGSGYPVQAAAARAATTTQRPRSAAPQGRGAAMSRYIVRARDRSVALVTAPPPGAPADPDDGDLRWRAREGPARESRRRSPSAVWRWSSPSVTRGAGGHARILQYLGEIQRQPDEQQARQRCRPAGNRCSRSRPMPRSVVGGHARYATASRKRSAAARRAATLGSGRAARRVIPRAAAARVGPRQSRPARRAVRPARRRPAPGPDRPAR